MRREVALETTRHFGDAGVTVVRSRSSHATLLAGPQHDRAFSTGHLNLDAGSLELEVDGRPLLVDSGTYLYLYDENVRRHFRGAAAHNTVTVDGRDPVENSHVFGWDEVHAARILDSRSFPGGVLVACERGLRGSGGARFVHRRCFVEFFGTWVVVDGVRGDGVESRHEVEALWHTTLPPSAVTTVGDHDISLGADFLVVDVFSSGGHDVSVLDDPDDMRTWYSRWYADLQRGATIRTAMPVGEGCRMVHVLHRVGVGVRFDGWKHGGPLLAVTGEAGTRAVAVALDEPALVVDGELLV
jgi:hypothetical protein